MATLNRNCFEKRLEWSAAPGEIFLPEPIQHMFWKQITKGEFLDTIFDCPFEMHELDLHPQTDGPQYPQSEKCL